LDNCIRWRHRKWVFLVLAVIEMICFGGFHYGYNALKEDYKNMSVFAEHCTENDCTKQDLMFDYAFNAWVNTQAVLISGAGLIMDKVGLRFLKLLAVAIYFIGTLMFAFTNGATSALLFPAGMFMGLGSVSSLICNHQISAMFPSVQGLVIALFSGAFDSSTVVTFVISKIAPEISLKTSFIAVAVGALVLGTFMGLFVMTQWVSDMGRKSSSSHEEKNVEDVIGDFPMKDVTGTAALDVDAKLQEIINKRFPSIKSESANVFFDKLEMWKEIKEIIDENINPRLDIMFQSVKGFSSSLFILYLVKTRF
uniref:MFS domain-containing protein n=1 Tax=Echinostoma caproni TaxID=27848 RepID=A0A183B0C7_9TREM